MLPPPLQPSYPKRPDRHHHGVLTLGSLAIGDGTATDTIGFLATTSALLWGPTDGFTATGFRIAVAGSGSKAIGVIEKQRVAGFPENLIAKKPTALSWRLRYRVTFPKEAVTRNRAHAS